MDLNGLYSLRRSFSLIGITGKMGSGASLFSEYITQSRSKIISSLPAVNSDFIRNSDLSSGNKYKICHKYVSENWTNYEIIQYKYVILFFILNKIKDESQISDLITNLYTTEIGKDYFKVPKVISEVKLLSNQNNTLVKDIQNLREIGENAKTKDQIKDLGDVFFSPSFQKFAKNLDNILIKYGYVERYHFLHHIANNLRKSGEPFYTEGSDMKYIYTIAHTINRLIKAKKELNKKDGKDCHIVISSLKNSLEIMFFRERYSAFYMLATNCSDNNRKQRIERRIKNIQNSLEVGFDDDLVLKELLKADNKEYKCADFKKGVFNVPDVQNCIQKSEIYIDTTDSLLDDRVSIDVNTDFIVKYQSIKLISLIQQPGIVTPTSEERCMQIANTAMLNSGCISRKVGAVVTDENFSVKAIGWNDVPTGAISCNLRDIDDLISNKNDDFSQYETGADSNDNKSKDFNKYLKYSYRNLKPENLRGRTCSFCFKDLYNKFEGKDNQVHTRSLHAEENAMLQISKYGGQALNNGILFTTASPCELCSKKAKQLGITKIIYVDPYPGISENHIFKSGKNNLKMIPFTGVVGSAYSNLYNPFMSYKDELTLVTSIKPLIKLNKSTENFISALTDNLNSKGKSLNTKLKIKLEGMIKDESLNVESIEKILMKGLDVSE